MATLASLQRGSPGANDSHARRVCSPSPTTPRGWKRQLRKTLLSSLGPCASKATVKRGILRSKSSKPAGNHDRDVGALQEPAGGVSWFAGESTMLRLRAGDPPIRHVPVELAFRKR